MFQEWKRPQISVQYFLIDPEIVSYFDCDDFSIYLEIAHALGRREFSEFLIIIVIVIFFYDRDRLPLKHDRGIQ